jgi:hypothetical protein
VFSRHGAKLKSGVSRDKSWIGLSEYEKDHYMRELTILETGYLAAGLLLSLVLPLLISFRGPVDAAARRECMKIVWTGQTLLTIAGLTVLVSPILAPYAAGLGLVGCIACAVLLLRRFQVVRTA